MCVLFFSTTFVLNISHSKTNSARYYLSVHRPLLVILCQILMTLELSRQIFEKSSNIKFHETCPMNAELFHTDRHDKTNSRFSRFCESP
jgi:hypothetical protein